jgi:DNA-binding PadR family transcriptional regulator
LLNVRQNRAVPLHHAVLGLLVQGPSYGYELKSDFEEAIGPQWGEFNIGHLYQILERLMRERLVTRRAVAQTDRPDKVVYRLTRAGQDELVKWLHAPFVRRGGYRDDFFLKIFVASRMGEEQLRTVIKVQREAFLSELGDLGELRHRYGSDPLVGLLLEAAILHTEANLKIAERTLERVKQLTVQRVLSEQMEGEDQSDVGA